MEIGQTVNGLRSPSPSSSALLPAPLSLNHPLFFYLLSPFYSPPSPVSTRATGGRGDEEASTAAPSTAAAAAAARTAAGSPPAGPSKQARRAPKGSTKKNGSNSSSSISTTNNNSSADNINNNGKGAPASSSSLLSDSLDDGADAVASPPPSPTPPSIPQVGEADGRPLAGVVSTSDDAAGPSSSSSYYPFPLGRGPRGERRYYRGPYDATALLTEALRRLRKRAPLPPGSPSAAAPDLAVRLLADRRTARTGIHPINYGAAIECCNALGGYAQADALFEEMTGAGVYWEAAFCSMVKSGAARGWGAEEGVQLVQRFEQGGSAGPGASKKQNGSDSSSSSGNGSSGNGGGGGSIATYKLLMTAMNLAAEVGDLPCARRVHERILQGEYAEAKGEAGQQQQQQQQRREGTAAAAEQGQSGASVSPGSDSSSGGKTAAAAAEAEAEADQQRCGSAAAAGTSGAGRRAPRRGAAFNGRDPTVEHNLLLK
jgi:hypothetical protein